MAFTPKQQKDYRDKMRKEGICVRCHKRKPNEGNAVCPRCIKILNARRRKNREDPTRCAECENKLDEWVLLMGSIRCNNCASKHLVRNHRYKLRRKNDKKEI